MIGSKVLLVQCCDLPQFFFVAEELRRRHAEWHIDLLVGNHPYLRYYLNHFGWADIHVFFAGQRRPGQYSAILFPLLNRGYAKIKRWAWMIKSRRMQIDYSGRIKDLDSFELAASILRVAHRPVSEFERFLQCFPYPELGKRLLIVESCDRSFIEERLDALKSLVPNGTEVHKLGRPSFRQTWKELRSRSFDGAILFLSSGFLFWSSRLPLLLRGVKKTLLIDENGEFSSGEPQDVGRLLFRRVFSRPRFSSQPLRVLFFQTEGHEYTAECLNRIRCRTLFPNARVLLVCREEDKPQLEGLKGVFRTVVWRQGRAFSQAREIRRQVIAFSPHINCASFTGRPVFRKQKLAYFLFGSANRLAFNAGRDVYWMSFRTLNRIFKKEPIQLSETQVSEVLLLETSNVDNMLTALGTLQKDNVVPNARITLFCREDKTSHFENYPRIVQILTYSKRPSQSNLPTLWKLLRMRPDVLVAVFAGSKIFSKHRLLFWLLPARNRLAFNQHLDCIYVTRTNFHLLFRETSGTPRSMLRNGIRVVLFLPRFFYLLTWWAGWKFTKWIQTGSSDECR